MRLLYSPTYKASNSLEPTLWIYPAGVGNEMLGYCGDMVLPFNMLPMLPSLIGKFTSVEVVIPHKITASDKNVAVQLLPDLMTDPLTYSAQLIDKPTGGAIPPEERLPGNVLFDITKAMMKDIIQVDRNNYHAMRRYGLLWYFNKKHRNYINPRLIDCITVMRSNIAEIMRL